MEEKFPFSGQGYTSGKLLDNTECIMLFDTGVSPTCQNHITCDVNHYIHYQSLHQQCSKFR